MSWYACRNMAVVGVKGRGRKTSSGESVNQDEDLLGVNLESALSMDSCMEGNV